MARVGEQNSDLKPTHLPRYIIALEHMDLLFMPRHIIVALYVYGEIGITLLPLTRS